MYSNSSSLPTFLLAGSSKTGTTTIYRYLKQHPQVFLASLKEPGFFTYEGRADVHRGIRNEPFISDIASYEALFSGIVDECAIGDCSPQTFDEADQATILRIKKYIPTARIIIVLRDPLGWALSAYRMYSRDGIEPCKTFAQAVERERSEVLAGSTTYPRYVWKKSPDSQRLRLFLDAFGPEQVRVFLYDDLLNDRQAFMREIFAFIGVDPTFALPRQHRTNTSGRPANVFFSFLFNRANPIRTISRLLLTSGMRDALKQKFIRPISETEKQADNEVVNELRAEVKDEVLAIQALIGRDLSHWL